MKSIKVFEELVCKPIGMSLKPKGFALTGIITEIIDDETIRFETQQKESVMDIYQVLTIEIKERNSTQELCQCGNVFYKKTSFDDTCAECKRKGTGD